MVRKAGSGYFDSGEALVHWPMCIYAIVQAFKASSTTIPLCSKVDSIGYAPALICVALVNLLIFAVACGIAYFSDATALAPFRWLAAMLGYMLVYLLYFSVVAIAHSYAAKAMPFSRALLVSASSLCYFPLVLVISEYAPIPAGYLIIVLAGFSSACIVKSMMQPFEDAGVIRTTCHTAFAVLTQYAIIHFYKNTLYFVIDPKAPLLWKEMLIDH